MAEAPEKWLTAEQAGKLVGVDDSTIRNWAKRGLLPVGTRVDGKLKWTKAAIETAEGNRSEHSFRTQESAARGKRPRTRREPKPVVHQERSDGMLFVGEAADLLGVSRTRVYQLREAGRIEGVKGGNGSTGRWLMSRNSIEQYMASEAPIWKDEKPGPHGETVNASGGIGETAVVSVGRPEQERAPATPATVEECLMRVEADLRELRYAVGRERKKLSASAVQALQEVLAR